jgi:hypothetical protein
VEHLAQQRVAQIEHEGEAAVALVDVADGQGARRQPGRQVQAQP